MDWREGTWTMTQEVRVYWTVDGDEILVTVDGTDFWLSERQTENMISGLSYQLNRLREERGRTASPGVAGGKTWCDE